MSTACSMFSTTVMAFISHSNPLYRQVGPGNSRSRCCTGDGAARAASAEKKRAAKYPARIVLKFVGEENTVKRGATDERADETAPGWNKQVNEARVGASTQPGGKNGLMDTHSHGLIYAVTTCDLLARGSLRAPRLPGCVRARRTKRCAHPSDMM